MDKKQRFQLNAEDMKEDAEFRKYIIETLAYNIGRLSPGGDGEKGSHRNDPDAQKAAEGRSSGSREWVRARGEDGASQNREQRQQ
jgi:peptide-N4-(N-acetyl-beta-glucosaminyl)asparagine amidase